MQMNQQIKELLLSNDEDDIRLATELLYRTKPKMLEFDDEEGADLRNHIPWPLFRLIEKYLKEKGEYKERANEIGSVIKKYLRDNNYIQIKTHMYDYNETASGQY